MSALLGFVLITLLHLNEPSLPILSVDTIAIKKVLPPTCQILFFSATYSQDIISFSERIINKAHLVTLSSDEDLILDVVFQVTDSPSPLFLLTYVCGDCVINLVLVPLPLSLIISIS